MSKPWYTLKLVFSPCLSYSVGSVQSLSSYFNFPCTWLKKSNKFTCIYVKNCILVLNHIKLTITNQVKVKLSPHVTCVNTVIQFYVSNSAGDEKIQVAALSRFHMKHCVKYIYTVQIYLGT